MTDRFGVVPVLNIQGAGYVMAGLLLMWLLPRRRAAPAREVTSVKAQAAGSPTTAVGRPSGM